MDRPQHARSPWTWLVAVATSGGLAASFFLARPIRGEAWLLIAALVGGLVGGPAVEVFREAAATRRADWSRAVVTAVVAPYVGSVLGSIVGMLIWLNPGLRPTDAMPMGDLAAGFAATALLAALFGALVIPIVTIPIAVVGAVLGAACGWGARRLRRGGPASLPPHDSPEAGDNPGRWPA